MPRVLSPPTLHKADDFGEGKMGAQAGSIGMQRNSSIQAAPRYAQPIRQMGSRFGTFHDSTTSNFSPQMGPRAQSHDIRLAQQTHQATQSMSGLNIQAGEGFGQSSQSRLTPGRHDVVSMPPGTSGQFGEPSYKAVHGETSDSIGSNLRHVQDYRETDFSPSGALTSNQFQGLFDEGHSGLGQAGPSRTQLWAHGNSTLQQHVTGPQMSYDPYHADDGRDTHTGHWNQTLPSGGLPGLTSPPLQLALIQQHVNGFPQSDSRGTAEPSRQSTYSRSAYIPVGLK
jgi:hypothetical protein